MAEQVADNSNTAPQFPPLHMPGGMAGHPMGDATAGIAFVGMDDRIQQANREMARFLGRPEEVLVGMQWQSLAHPDEAAENFALGQRLVIGLQDRFRLPRRFLHADGSTLYGDLAASIVRDQDGNPRLFVAEVIDRTAETRALVDLAASTAQYRLLLEHTAEMIIRTSPSGVVEWVSPASVEVLGYRPEDLIGHAGTEFFHPDDIPPRNEAMERLAKGQSTSIDVRLRRADGQWRWMHADTRPVQDADGQVVGLVSSWRPIDDEVAGREALRATEALVQSIIDASPDTIAVADVDGTVRFVTPDVAEVLRLESADVPLGRNIIEFIVPEQRERAAASVEVLINGDPGGPGPFACLRGDGTSVETEITGRVIRAAGGSPTGVVYVIRDITARRETERLLRESEERLTEARRLEALGRLAGGVAHDFNNILMAINGTAEMLAESLGSADPRHADAIAILEAGGRAAALTAQLLAFGRRQVLRPRVIDLGAVLTELAPMLRRTLGTSVSLKLDVGPGAVAVRADRSQLEQVVINLVFNARDAMPDGGLLTVASDVEAVDAPPTDSPMAGQPGAYARLRVIDTGTGIDDATLSRIFEPFFTTKEHGRGTGLGLATVAGIVGQSGGWVAVDSVVGRGTTFAVYLPQADAEPAEAPIEDGAATAAVASASASASASAAVAQAGVPTLVLLVEDDDVVRTACARLLRGLGYGVLEQHTPEAALALSDDALAKIDVILSDIVMPGMDGTVMAHRLRERRPDLPVLFMSGHTPDPRAQEHLAEPGASFLAKPFTQRSLDAALRALLE